MELSREELDELMGHIVAMRNAKHEVEACQRFLTDANMDLNAALVRQSNATASYNAWVEQHPQLALPLREAS